MRRPEAAPNPTIWLSGSMHQEIEFRAVRRTAPNREKALFFGVSRPSPVARRLLGYGMGVFPDEGAAGR